MFFLWSRCQVVYGWLLWETFYFAVHFDHFYLGTERKGNCFLIERAAGDSECGCAFLNIYIHPRRSSKLPRPIVWPWNVSWWLLSSKASAPPASQARHFLHSWSSIVLLETTPVLEPGDRAPEGFQRPIVAAPHGLAAGVFVCPSLFSPPSSSSSSQYPSHSVTISLCLPLPLLNPLHYLSVTK